MNYYAFPPRKTHSDASCILKYSLDHRGYCFVPRPNRTPRNKRFTFWKPSNPFHVHSMQPSTDFRRCSSRQARCFESRRLVFFRVSALISAAYIFIAYLWEDLGRSSSLRVVVSSLLDNPVFSVFFVRDKILKYANRGLIFPELPPPRIENWSHRRVSIYLACCCFDWSPRPFVFVSPDPCPSSRTTVLCHGRTCLTAPFRCITWKHW